MWWWEFDGRDIPTDAFLNNVGCGLVCDEGQVARRLRGVLAILVLSTHKNWVDFRTKPAETNLCLMVFAPIRNFETLSAWKEHWSRATRERRFIKRTTCRLRSIIALQSRADATRTDGRRSISIITRLGRQYRGRFDFSVRIAGINFVVFSRCYSFVDSTEEIVLGITKPDRPITVLGCTTENERTRNHLVVSAVVQNSRADSPINITKPHVILISTSFPSRIFTTFSSEFTFFNEIIIFFFL